MTKRSSNFMPSPSSGVSSDSPADPRQRIVAAARKHFFSFGYSTWTMDELAAGLGMSKKTLYVHFPSKDALVEAILEGFVTDLRSNADALFKDTSLSFTAKLHRFAEAMVRRLGQVNPNVFRDLQRSAPHIYRHIEELRHNNIPYVFGQLVRQGQEAGMIRDDIDPAFAIEFWRPAIQSLMHPDTIERLQLSPDQMFTKAIHLFFHGLLTPAGRRDHEKNI